MARVLTVEGSRGYAAKGAPREGPGQACSCGGEGGIRTHEAFARRFSRPLPSTTRPPLRDRPYPHVVGRVRCGCDDRGTSQSPVRGSLRLLTIVTAHLVAVSPLDRSGRRTSLIGEQLDHAMPATEWLEEAVLRHSPMLLAAARALTAHEADARDLVQGTIEIALRKGGQIRDRDALPAWLLTVQAREALEGEAPASQVPVVRALRHRASRRSASPGRGGTASGVGKAVAASSRRRRPPPHGGPVGRQRCCGPWVVLNTVKTQLKTGPVAFEVAG